MHFRPALKLILLYVFCKLLRLEVVQLTDPDVDDLVRSLGEEKILAKLRLYADYCYKGIKYCYLWCECVQLFACVNVGTVHTCLWYDHRDTGVPIT